MSYIKIKGRRILARMIRKIKKKMMPVKFLNIVNTQQMVIGIIMPCCLGAFTPHFVLI